MSEPIFTGGRLEGALAPYMRADRLRCDVAGFTVLAMPPGEVDLDIRMENHVVNVAPYALGMATVSKVNGSTVHLPTLSKDGTLLHAAMSDLQIVGNNTGWELLVEFDQRVLSNLMFEHVDGRELAQRDLIGGIDPVVASLARFAIEHLSQRVVDRLYLEGLAISITARTLGFALGDRAAPATTGTDARLARAIDYAQTHLVEGITVADLAGVACMSPSWFSRAFKAHTGFTVHGYVLEQRLERARQDLILTTEPIGNIAHACGFADHSHLTRLFRRRYGVTPSTLRK